MSTTNAPTIDLAAALDPAVIMSYLEYEYAGPSVRRNDLMAAHQRFLDATHNGIQDDAVTGRATDFAKQLKAAAKDTDEIRAKIKAPVLTAQRLIDGEAKKIVDDLTRATQSVESRIADYLRAKEASARAAAMAEAKRLADEAEAAIQAALVSSTTEADQAAVEAIDEAQHAATMAAAPPIEITRTRSQFGSIAALKDNWVYTVEDISKVPAAFLTINDTMIKAAIKTGTREIPGLRIVNDAKVMVR